MALEFSSKSIKFKKSKFSHKNFIVELFYIHCLNFFGSFFKRKRKECWFFCCVLCERISSFPYRRSNKRAWTNRRARGNEMKYKDEKKNKRRRNGRMKRGFRWLAFTLFVIFWALRNKFPIHEWMTKWISNKLLIRLISLSSTCCVCLRIDICHVMHAVWKWIQISRITYVNVISPNRPCISDSLSLRLRSPWFSLCMERFQCISDRLLLMYGIPDAMLTQYVIRCVYGVPVHSYCFFLFARSWSNIVCFCSCVISYKRCIASKQMLLTSITFRLKAAEIHFSISKKNHTLTMCTWKGIAQEKDGQARWCLLFQLNTHFKRFLTFNLFA